MQVTMTVNGETVTREIEGRLLLVHFLRDELGLTGTHWGCDTSNCGTCVAWLDGEPVKTCTVLAAMAGGHEVRTVEGLEVDGVLDPVQEGFMQCHGLQCGFCTPGMLMTDPRAARPRPGPDRGHDPRGDLRPDLPVHRLHHHRPLGAVGGRQGTRGRRPRRPTATPRPWGARHDHHRRPRGPRERRQRPDARRPRPDAPQGGPALHPRHGPVRRRHRAARHAAPRDPALAGRARPDRQHRHQRRRRRTPR